MCRSVGETPLVGGGSLQVMVCLLFGLMSDFAALVQFQIMVMFFIWLFSGWGPMTPFGVGLVPFFMKIPIRKFACGLGMQVPLHNRFFCQYERQGLGFDVPSYALKSVSSRSLQFGAISFCSSLTVAEKFVLAAVLSYFLCIYIVFGFVMYVFYALELCSSFINGSGHLRVPGFSLLRL